MSENPNIEEYEDLPPYKGWSVSTWVVKKTKTRKYAANLDEDHPYFREKSLKDIHKAIDNHLDSTPSEKMYAVKHYKLPNELVEEFEKKVKALAIEMFGEDCSGNPPVQTIVVDRSRYERMPFLHVPRINEDEATDEENEAVLSMLTGNISIATGELNSYMRLRQHYINEKNKKSASSDA